jgi:hypothetical protein
METTALGAPASTSPEPAPSLEALLVKCAPDRLTLNKEIDELIGALQFAAIRAVETALPDFREPGSTDCKLHGALRNDLLNKFNGKRRELLNVTKNYLVTQVFVREVVTHIQIAGTGVHNLPPGVEMPRR